MIHEELYIIVDDKRNKLDLPSPSGITLNFVSNLFNDLSKICASYTYTFKLPRTVNNCCVLELADDIRSDCRFTKVSSEVELTYDGVSLFTNANLYISGVDGRDISAVITWNVNKGLQNLSDMDMSLNELGKFLPVGEYDYKGDAASDYETDKVVHVDSDFNKLDDYDPNKPYFKSLHSAGVDPFYREQPRVDSVTGKLSSLPPITIDEEFPEGAAISMLSGIPTKYRYTYAYPTPIVPVPYIIEVISKIFELEFDFSGELYKSLCLPLIENKQSDALVRLNYVRLSFTAASAGGILSLNGSVVNNYPHINPIIGLEYLDDKVDLGHISSALLGSAVEKAAIFFETKGLNAQCTELKYRIGGKVKIKARSSGEVMIGEDAPKLYLKSLPYSGDKLMDLGSISPVSMYAVWESGVPYDVMEYDLEPTDGYENFESDVVYTHGLAFFLRYGKDGDKSFGTDVTFEGAFKIYCASTNYVYNQHVNLFANLPDISCLEFIKSICYALGGYPYQDAEGVIHLQQYSSLVDFVKKGDITDWSDRIINTFGQNAEEISYSANETTDISLCRKNYFLMKNDEIDPYGKEIPNDRKEDAYEHGYLRIDVDNDMLDKFQTIFTFPFYGAFLWQKGFYTPFEYDGSYFTKPVTATLNGQDIWHITKFDAFQLFYESTESKPMMGIVSHRDIDIYEESYYEDEMQDGTIVGGTDYQPTGEKVRFLSMRVWNCARDMVVEANYDALRSMLNHPCLIKEQLRLNVYDLVGMNVEKPVYLEKYNSYFAIKKIEVSSEGACICELIKIPTEIL